MPRTRELAAMGPYPDLQPALPTSYVRPSRTSKILKPGIVLTTVIILGITSVVGLGVAIAILSSSSPHSKSITVTQVFALIASVLSMVYIVLHGIAAIHNDAVGVVRPPELKLHAACFIIARLVMMMWFMVFVAATVVISRPNVCMKGTQACQMQVADVVVSIFAFIATGIILTALESCAFPFETPDFLGLTRKITCRVSSFADDMLERSVSRGSSFDGPFEREKPQTAKSSTNIERKPLPKAPSDGSDEAPERPLTPLLPMARRNKSGSKGWGEEWTHLVRDTNMVKENVPAKENLKNSDSAISLTYETSSEYMSSSDRSSHTRVSSYNSASRRSAVSRRVARPRVVTPSSSISNLSRRSPLSTVRSAEFPDVLVRPELRYCPPNIPPPHGWHPSRTSSISQLLPIADVYGLQRRSSVTLPEELQIRRPSKTLPPLPRKQEPIKRRRTVDIKVPGAYVEFPQGMNYEQSIDEHVRKIEVEFVTRSQSKRNQPDEGSKSTPASIMSRPSLSSSRPPTSLSQYIAASRSQSPKGIRQYPSILGPRPIRAFRGPPSARSWSPSNHSQQPSFSRTRSSTSVSQHSSASSSDEPAGHSKRASFSRTRSSSGLSQVSSISDFQPPSGLNQHPIVLETRPGTGDRRIPPKRVDSRSRYREKRPLINRAHTTVGSTEPRPFTANPTGVKKPDDEKVKPFRRLSLGDISPSFGKLFES